MARLSRGSVPTSAGAALRSGTGVVIGERQTCGRGPTDEPFCGSSARSRPIARRTMNFPAPFTVWIGYERSPVLLALEARVAEGAASPAEEREAATLRDEFVRLAARHLDGAYKLAGYLLGDAAEAEDAMQEALTRAWRAWPRLREPDSVDRKSTR